MSDLLSTRNNFQSLSIKDLLAARDLYHYHLLNKAHVIGTAVGLYLIRKKDPYPSKKGELLASRRRSRDRGERTFANSEVREYSWPCVLVVVSDWVKASGFGGSDGRLRADQMVPKTLYLPDGRMVPVCVVKAEQGEAGTGVVPPWHWPGGLFAAGMPITVLTQGRKRDATAGCLVTDGHTVYALTSRHVCGASGEPVFTTARGRRVQIGHANARHLTRLPFSEVYPEFPSHRTYLNLDVGLVELSHVDDWSSQPYGLEPTGPLADLNELNIGPQLIDAPVVASSAASGRLEGRIKALFYRYKSVGGYDYVADFLIAPRILDEDARGRGKPDWPQTQPGDSGAVWHLVVPPAGEEDKPDRNDFVGELRPLAIEWGGQVILESASQERFTFALATSLTAVCQSLDVELVLRHNTGATAYWGQMGHYSIATFACDALGTGKLRTLIAANVANVSFALGELTPAEISERLKQAKANNGFVPLADVPDVVWKQHKDHVIGGRDDRFIDKGRTTGPEHPTHYADIDVPRKSDGRILRDLCMTNPANLSVPFWQQFYTNLGRTEQHERGLLPFRVWQFYDALVDLARAGDTTGFVAAAGLLSHYVGDACQPLHGSMYADGYEDRKTTIVHHRRGTGEEYTEESHVGAGVHSTYETKMIERHASDIVDGLKSAIKGAAPALPQIQNGHDAAMAIISLMDRSAQAIPPQNLVEAYLKAGAKGTVAVQDALWEKYDDETIGVMADGARVLAHIWQSAWDAGNGNVLAKSKLGAADPDKLVERYVDRNFVPSLDLDHIGPLLQ